MRRYTFLSLIAAFCFLFGTGCEDADCKHCKKVTYENGSKVNEGSEQEYCGDELDEKEQYEEEVGNRREEYECRI